MADEAYDYWKLSVGWKCADETFKKLKSREIRSVPAVDAEVARQCQDQQTKFFAQLRLLNLLLNSVEASSIESHFLNGG